MVAELSQGYFKALIKQSQDSVTEQRKPRRKKKIEDPFMEELL